VNAGADAIRRIEVRPLSARIELGNVVRVGMVVVISVWMYLATDGGGLHGAASDRRHLLPFQALIQDRPSVEQRMFRELQEGLLEAETRRADTGSWPTVAALVADGIPPFAPDPTAKAGTYDWRAIVSGTFVNYLGVPQQPNAPAWLVLIQEPDPGAPPDPAREDEEHHRLVSGAMLHVSTWIRTDTNIARRIVRTPQAEGWTQLYAVGPALPINPTQTGGSR
jgi:hypothetical protein